MQQRNALELLADVLRYGRLARRFASEGTIATFPDGSERYATERCLQIVGEGVTKLIAGDPDLLRQISDAQRIVAFRHLLTHHYYRISTRLLLQIVQSSLPLLEREAANLLAAGASQGEI